VQDVDRAAFDHAFSLLAGEPRREEPAHRNAWAASVERGCVKLGDSWVRRTGGQE
jgi:cation transport regulator